LLVKSAVVGKAIFRGDDMASYVDPKLQSRFESLSIDLKNAILNKNVKLYTLQDLISCLESIVEGK
jgi:hypothetical protein